MIHLDTTMLAIALAAVAVTAWAVIARRGRWDADARAFGTTQHDPSPGRPYTASRRAAMLRLSALVLLALAVAAPRWAGPAETSSEPDLVIVLDVSMSMRVADIAPSRLDEAKRQIHDALSVPLTARVALVAFAAAPMLVCPPTTDRVAFADLLAATDEDAAPPGPSRAGPALRRALEVLGPRGGDVVLVSDGEFPDEDRAGLPEVVTMARRLGVRVSSVAVGTRAGGPVPVRGARPPRPALGTDGSPLHSVVDTAVLAWIATETGGESQALVAGGELDLSGLIARRQRAADRAPRHLRPFGPVSLQGYPLLVALLLLALDAWLSGRGARARRLTAVGVFALAWVAPAPAIAQAPVAAVLRGNESLQAGRIDEAIQTYRRALELDPASAIARANLGTALARAGQLEAAAVELSAAAESLTTPDHRARVHYNLGTVLAQLGRLDDALGALRASLRIRDDADARFNYALVWQWRQAQGGQGLAPDAPLEPQRVQQLREKARALDVPVVRRPADRRTPDGADR